jgi:hypothetical protein
MIKKADWLAITKDRVAIVLLFIVVVEVIAIIVTTIIRIHPSDIQIPVRFTGYGQSNIDRDQWYTQLSYVFFGVIVAAFNGFLAIKLYSLSRRVGLGLMAMSIFVLVVALIIANAIFNLAPTV